jgi:hypothetical protein
VFIITGQGWCHLNIVKSNILYSLSTVTERCHAQLEQVDIRVQLQECRHCKVKCVITFKKDLAFSSQLAVLLPSKLDISKIIKHVLTEGWRIH